MAITKQAIIDIKTRGIPGAERSGRKLFDALTKSTKAAGKLGATIKLAGKDFRKGSAQSVAAINRTNAALKKQTQLLGGLAKAGAALKLIGGAVQSIRLQARAFSALRDVLEFAANDEAIRTSFENLVGGANAGVDATNKLRSATRGLVDDTNLQRAATAILVTGADISIDKLGTLFELMIRQGRTAGQNAVTSVLGLADALRKVTDRALRSTGVNIRLETSLIAFAKAQGIASTELTQSQRRGVLLKATFEALTDSTKRLGDAQTPLTIATDLITARMENLKSRLAEIVATPEFVVFLENVSNLIVQVSTALVPLLNQLSRLGALLTSVPGLTGFLAGVGPGAIAGAGIGALAGGPAGAVAGAGIGGLAGGILGGALDIFGRSTGETLGAGQARQIGNRVRGAIQTGISEGLDTFGKEFEATLLQPSFEGGL